MTLFLLAAIFYFVPFAVAHMRGHRNAVAIFVLNLLLGWTFIGWVVALVWACTSNTDAAIRKRNERGGLYVIVIAGLLILGLIFTTHSTSPAPSSISYKEFPRNAASEPTATPEPSIYYKEFPPNANPTPYVAPTPFILASTPEPTAMPASSIYYKEFPRNASPTPESTVEATPEPTARPEPTTPESTMPEILIYTTPTPAPITHQKKPHQN